MIALITSTIFPSDKLLFNYKRTIYSHSDRIMQTRQTIDSLKAIGINNIWLLDNSSKKYEEIIKKEFSDIFVLSFEQYQFNNKSINEILLILSAITYLPHNIPILKISGRYKLNKNYTHPDKSEWDLVVKSYFSGRSNSSVSTRLYFAKDRDILEKLMLECLNELFRYSLYPVGLRSLWRIIKNLYIKYIPTEPKESIEFIASRVIKNNHYNVIYREVIGVEGLVAVSGDKIEE